MGADRAAYTVQLSANAPNRATRRDGESRANHTATRSTAAPEQRPWRDRPATQFGAAGYQDLDAPPSADVCGRTLGVRGRSESHEISRNQDKTTFSDRMVPGAATDCADSAVHRKLPPAPGIL